MFFQSLKDLKTNFSSHLAAQVVYENTILCLRLSGKKDD